MVSDKILDHLGRHGSSFQETVVDDIEGLTEESTSLSRSSRTRGSVLINTCTSMLHVVHCWCRHDIRSGMNKINLAYWHLPECEGKKGRKINGERVIIKGYYNSRKCFSKYFIFGVSQLWMVIWESKINIFVLKTAFSAWLDLISFSLTVIIYCKRS